MSQETFFNWQACRNGYDTCDIGTSATTRPQEDWNISVAAWATLGKLLEDISRLAPSGKYVDD